MKPIIGFLLLIPFMLLILYGVFISIPYIYSFTLVWYDRSPWTLITTVTFYMAMVGANMMEQCD